MSTSSAVSSGREKVFMAGNEVIAWAAINAGVDMMFGYPITPQNEIMHHWSSLIKKYERGFLQTEDELSAGFATLGSILAGRKSFSATSGPGTILFQESLSMAEMMRIPMVLIVQQRGGPSTATVIYSQQEVNLAVRGGNGEGLRIVYSTSSHQELYDYTIKSFNVAWKYRFPVILLGDGYQAKMKESLMIYNPWEEGVEMASPEPSLGLEGKIGKDRYAAYLRNAYSVEEDLAEALWPIKKDYDAYATKLIEYEEDHLEGAEVLVVSHGIASRGVKEAVASLREKGLKAGYFRPITLQPFPKKRLQEIAKKVPRILIVESSLGQFGNLVKEVIKLDDKNIYEYYRPGLGITVEEVENEVKKCLANKTNVQ